MGNCGCCENSKETIYADFLQRCDKGELRYVEDALQLRRSEMKKLMRVFHLIDIDESGSVSMAEMVRVTTLLCPEACLPTHPLPYPYTRLTF